MRINWDRCVVVIAIITACLLATALWPAGAISHAALTRLEGSAKTSDPPILPVLAVAAEPTRLRANGAYGKLPLSFEMNQGQGQPSIGTILNPTGTTGTLGGTVNNTNGMISLLGGSVLLVNTSAFTNAGFITMDIGSTLTMGAGNNFTQTSGQTTVNGTLNATGQVNIAGGILNGTGTVNADVNSGGRVNPGQSPGVLNITGNYTQTSGGTLGIELNGVTAGSGYHIR
jgi:hypothetical protein